MADFHRLVPPTYLGGVPSTHDEINNASSGTPAMTDVAKVGGPNAGSYFIAFGEDGTSSNGNRAHQALAQNTDYLDDIVNGEAPVVDDLAFLSAGDTSRVLTGDVFVGKPGTSNNQDERDRLIKIVDAATGNDVLDAAGNTVKASLIHNGAAVSQVGVPATGFFTGPTVNFSSTIPAGSSYRIFFGRRSSLRDAILDKTRLDAFTRQVIRGAHQVPGESLRFIREAGRRSGGSVVALAATIIETPGLGENLLAKANAITVDVDPDDTQGDNGIFSVRFNRDVSPAVHFRVNEGTGVDDGTWENAAERIAFLDPNHVGSGFTPANVPLSEPVLGARSLSIQGSDPGTQAASILRRLNARQAITCGGTYGDFIGATAIEDAIDFAVAAGQTYLHLKLTEDGGFTVSNKTVPIDLVIEGVGPGSNPNYGSAISTDGAVTNGLNISAGVEFTARNVTFRNAGGIATHAFTAAAGASVLCENCLFENRVILNNSVGTRSFASIFRDCRFVTDAATSGSNGIIELTCADTADTYLFENCFFATSTRLAVMKITPGAPVVTTTCRNIRFRNCVMELQAATVTAGDPDWNAGVIFMENLGNGRMVFQDITFENCHVLANVLSTPSAAATLLDFRAPTSSPVRNFNILGGRWEINPVDSLVSPFFLGGQVATLPNFTSLENVRVEDVEWGFTGTTSTVYGAAATALGFNGSANEWAAFFISASNSVRMKNVKWLTCTAQSDVGDLFIDETEHLNIDGLEFRTWVDTAASVVPAYRIRFFGEQTIGNRQVVDGVIMDGNSIATQVVTEGLARIMANNNFVCRNWHLGSFLHATSRGIFLPLSNATTGNPNGLRLETCRLNSLGGAGIYFQDSAVATVPFGELTIEHCKIFACDVGVHITDDGTGTDLLFRIRLDNNEISSCTNEGVVLEPADFSAQGGIIFSNNHIHTNNGGIANVQMRIGSPSNQFGDNCAGAMYANDFGGNPGSEGQVEFNVTATNDPVDFWGSHTGLGTSASPPAGGYPHGEKQWTSGAQFLDNRGRYLET